MPSTAVFNEIREILEKNGSISQETKDKLIMTALVCVWAELQEIKKERAKWKDHLMMTATSVLVSFLVVYILFRVTGFMP